MSSKAFLRQDYNEQLDLYSRLTNDEIISLYATEGITGSTILDEINNIYSKIGETRNNKAQIENRLSKARNSVSNITSQEIEQLENLIKDMEQKLDELIEISEQVEKSNVFKEYAKGSAFDEAIVNIEAEIDRLKNRLSSATKEMIGPEDNESTICRLNKEIDNLYKEISKLNKKRKVDYIIKSTTKITPHTRKFPSVELRNMIVCGTLGLAKYWARIYYIKCSKKVLLDDINQMAREALISAAHYYIPNDRAKFTTYASKCIQNKLTREIFERKKRSCKPSNFFETEEKRITYLKMYFESMYTINNKTGKEFFKPPKEDSVLLFRLNGRISYYNFDKSRRLEPWKMLPRIHGKRTSEKFDAIINDFFRFMKEGKLQTLITDDDRDLINAEMVRNGIPKNELEIKQVLVYFDLYLKRLNMIKHYFEIEKQLYTQNKGIVPTDEEILTELNRGIIELNRQKYKLKQTNFYNQDKPFYEVLFDYYNEYRTEYNVDFFVEGAREEEKESLASEYEDIGYRIDELEEMIDNITECECDKVILSLFHDDELGEWCGEYSEYEEDEDPDYNGEIYSIKGALDKLKSLLVNLPEKYKNQEAYVKHVLKLRSNTVNAILKEKNAPIIAKNLEIAKQRDMHELGGNYQHHFKERDLYNIKHDIELLYGDDDELMTFIASGRGRFKTQRIDPTEEEALNNSFFADYYRALDELPTKEKEVMIRFFDENGHHGMRAKEIANELDISQSEVYKLKENAIKRLKKNTNLESYYLS